MIQLGLAGINKVMIEAEIKTPADRFFLAEFVIGQLKSNRFVVARPDK